MWRVTTMIPPPVSLFKRLVKVVLLPFFRLNALRVPAGVIILGYHRVGDKGGPPEMRVTTCVFARQMDYVVSNYRIVSLAQVAELAALHSLERDCVAITFDDGYQDFYRNAFPILLERGIQATLYLSPWYVETGSYYPWEQPHEGNRVLTWSQIREVVASGLISIGSHTYSHRVLTGLPRSLVEFELRKSKELLESRLEVPADHFCFPKGCYDEQSMALAAALYKTVIGGRRTKNVPPLNAHDLGRYPIQQSDGVFLFKAKLRGWLEDEQMLEIPRLMRYRLLRKWVAFREKGSPEW